MRQEDRLYYLIRYLEDEYPQGSGLTLPGTLREQKRLLRSLMNVREPKACGKEFLEIQDAFLRKECELKGIVSLEELEPVEKGIYLWQGDITRLRADAIVNAANSGLLGCFIPCHGCIDNAIHSSAGVQLRLACHDIMKRQGTAEATGRAKITEGYNLPCRYVLHTVGPIVHGRLTQDDRRLLASCYRSCLELAASCGLASVAFCCISTGEFHFPQEEAARIAVDTVRGYLEEKESGMEVIFNVYKDSDLAVYRRLLGTNKKVI